MSKTTTSKKCCDDVKRIFFNNGHKKCTGVNDRNRSKIVKGRLLNEHLFYAGILHKIDTPFNDRKNYEICHNLFRYIAKYTVSNPVVEYSGIYSSSSSNSSTDEVDNTETRCNDRNTRMSLRNKVPIRDLKGIKNVSVSVSGKVSSIIDCNSFKRNTDLFEKDVMSKYYKVPFDKLVMRERTRRINELSKMILSYCIDRS